MKVYAGRVVSGAGRMSEKMQCGSVSRDVFESAASESLYSGTLNIELDMQVYVEDGSKLVARQEKGVRTKIFVKSILTENIHAHIIRSEATENDQGRYSRRIVEVVSTHNLRQLLTLSDEDVVKLRF